MGFYTVVHVNVGVFKTIFGVQPFKIKSRYMLNIYNFIKQYAKAKGNICQLLS